MAFDTLPKDWTFASGSLPGRRRSELGLWLFVLSLAIFFVSCFLAIAIVAVLTPRAEGFDVPPLLWATTAVAVVAGWLASRAWVYIRRERRREFLACLVGALGLGVVFCVLQGFAAASVVGEHLEKRAELDAAIATAENAGKALPKTEALALKQEAIAAHPLPATGILVSLIVLHAAHFAGGLGFGGWVTWRALDGEFDHEVHAPVKFNAIYWRFMDGVWLATFGLLLWL